MKSGEKLKVEILRFAISFITKEEKDQKKELSDSETLQVLKRVLKRNQESYDQFIKAGRSDLAEKEKKEMDLIQVYLPTLLSEAETTAIVKEAIKSLEIDSIKNMGKVMAYIKNTHSENVDMSLVSKLTKKLLS
tara:strand:+ start:113 stop:514 length:402 start_codon:yes stop_codon:yes gene_type:complete